MAFTFGTPAAPAPAPAAGFTFGTPAAAPAPAPAFTFGTPAAAPAPAAGFTFGTPAAAPATSAGFTFGAPAAAPATSAGFTFGAPAPAASAGFTFGAPAAGTTALGAPAAQAQGWTQYTRVSDLPADVKTMLQHLQAHIDAQRAAATGVQAHTYQHLQTLTRQRKAVEEAASSLATLQKVQSSTIRGLQGDVDQDQRHVDSAIQHIRRLPAGFVREIQLPSQFLHDNVERSKQRMGELQQRIDEVEQMLIPLVDGPGSVASTMGHEPRQLEDRSSLDPRQAITPELLRQVLVAQNAAFIRVAGGPVATCHEQASELRREYKALLTATRREQNKTSTQTTYESYGSAAEVDPFQEADTKEKDRERLIGDLKRSSVMSNQAFLPGAAGPGAPYYPGTPPVAGTGATYALPTTPTASTTFAWGTPAPAPAPAFSFMAPAPAPTSSPFSFGLGAPAPASSPFSATYAAPTPAPAFSFGSPAPAPSYGYGAPAPAPAFSFGAPAPAPAYGYAAPAPAPYGYAAPAPVYGAPAPAYGAPAPAYGAPQMPAAPAPLRRQGGRRRRGKNR